MESTQATDPALAQALSRLTAIGVSMAEAVNDVAQFERRAVAAACRWLPSNDAAPTSLADATEIGQGIDAATAAIAEATPRLTALTRNYERLSRAVRRTVALARRLEQGWPLPRTLSDTSRAMRLRQIIHATRETIRAHTGTDTEAAERLFADLNAHLDDPIFEQDLLDLPIKEALQRLRTALGLSPQTAKPPLATTHHRPPK